MHQPLYRGPGSSRFELPWVRLHAIDSYYGMARLIGDFPGVKVTFNLVPVLLQQIQAYADGGRDFLQEICQKPAADLTAQETDTLARYGFEIPHPGRILRFPAYRRLWEKWRSLPADGGDRLRGGFTAEEIRDLQVWLPLSHFAEPVRAGDIDIQGLVEKGSGFSEADKTLLAAKEREVIASVVPLYRDLWSAGRIEISTSPFYHPILPLLIDPQEGRRSNPSLPAYDLAFHWEEDARTQLESGLAFVEDALGQRPRGIWPSEGSLSAAVIRMLAELGIRWAASDGQNLEQSLDQEIAGSRGWLYRPYRFADTPVRLFFRDRFISDRIGFTYQTWDPEEAARDLVGHLEQVAADTPANAVVSIILDGENPWAYYRDGGLRFLEGVYRRLEKHAGLRTIGFSDACDLPGGRLSRFSSGSWIDGNFDIWIGGEEDRRAWRLLEQTREAFVAVRDALPEARLHRALTCLLAAEGSDWFWWFGKEHHTDELDVFDRLFRAYLIQVHLEAGLEPPADLRRPVPQTLREPHPAPPAAMVRIRPHVDGRVGHLFEWLGAVRVEAGLGGAVMAAAESRVDAIHYGFDGHHLFLRLDPSRNPDRPFFDGSEIRLHVSAGGRTVTLPLKEETLQDGEAGAGPVAAATDIVEVMVPLDILGAPATQAVSVWLEWLREGRQVFRVPPRDALSLEVPDPRRMARGWLV